MAERRRPGHLIDAGAMLDPILAEARRRLTIQPSRPTDLRELTRMCEWALDRVHRDFGVDSGSDHELRAFLQENKPPSVTAKNAALVNIHESVASIAFTAKELMELTTRNGVRAPDAVRHLANAYETRDISGIADAEIARRIVLGMRQNSMFSTHVAFFTTAEAVRKMTDDDVELPASLLGSAGQLPHNPMVVMLDLEVPWNGIGVRGRELSQLVRRLDFGPEGIANLRFVRPFQLNFAIGEDGIHMTLHARDKDSDQIAILPIPPDTQMFSRLATIPAFLSRLPVYEVRDRPQGGAPSEAGSARHQTPAESGHAVTKPVTTKMISEVMRRAHREGVPVPGQDRAAHLRLVRLTKAQLDLLGLKNEKGGPVYCRAVAVKLAAVHPEQPRAARTIDASEMDMETGIRRRYLNNVKGAPEIKAGDVVSVSRAGEESLTGHHIAGKERPKTLER